MIEMEETSTIWSETKTLYLHISLSQAVLEKLSEPLKGLGEVSIKIKIDDDLEVWCFPLTMSSC